MRSHISTVLAAMLALGALSSACGDNQPPAPHGAGVPVQLPATQPMVAPVVQQAPSDSRGGQPISPPAQASPAADSSSRYWVWLREKAPGIEKTYELVETAGVYSQVSVHDGVRIWLDGASMEISRIPHKLKRCLCDPETQETKCVDGEHNVFYSTQATSQGKTTPLSKLPKDAKNMEDAGHSVVFMASIGPYLAVEQSVSQTGGCTAHGTYFTELAWYDIRSGNTVDMLEMFPPPKRIVKQLDKKLGSQVSACEEGGGLSGEDLDSKVVGLEPLWAKGGIVRRYVGSAPVPYTCSGDDSAYATSARFGALPFTGELEQLSKVPAEMEKLIKKLAPGGSLGGVYKLPPTAPALSQ